jgi:hypothetical protein
MGSVFTASKKKRIAVKSKGLCWYCGCNTRKWGRNLEEYRYFLAFPADLHKARKALGTALHLLPIAQAIAIAEVIEWIESQEQEVVFYGESLGLSIQGKSDGL